MNSDICKVFNEKFRYYFGIKSRDHDGGSPSLVVGIWYECQCLMDFSHRKMNPCGMLSVIKVMEGEME